MRRTLVHDLLACVLTVAGVVAIGPPGAAAAAGRSAIFGGGPFYEDGQAVIDTTSATPGGPVGWRT